MKVLPFRPLAHLAIILSIGALPLALGASEDSAMKGVEKHASGHARIPMQVTEDLKIVYQVSDDKFKDGVSRALFYARKLLDTYNASDVADEEIDLHLVFHSDGTNALVDGKTRERLEAEGGAANPNTDILNELVSRGVSIELCESSMKQRGVVPEDLVEGVATVVGAFPRIINLQHLGYAYIKFE